MRKRLSIAIYVLMVSGIWAVAENGGIAVSGKIGSLGPGVEMTTWILEDLNVRLGGYYLPVGFSMSQDNTEYDIKLKWATMLAVLDWYPFYWNESVSPTFANHFRVSGGIAYDRNEYESDGHPNGARKIGDVVYTQEQIGTLNGHIKFNTLAPYIGIGYGDAVAEDESIGFFFDLGILIQGMPKATLTADGTMKDDPGFLSELSKEEDDLKRAAEIFMIYPVVSFGVSYQF